MNELFSVSSLHTVSGGGLADLLVIQLIKDWPFANRIPTKLLSVIVGELLILGISSFPQSLDKWVVLVLNGILIASTAIGGLHLVNDVSFSHRR